jgi:hypothetical protein
MPRYPHPSDEYAELLRIWNNLVKPELFDYTKQAPNQWRTLYFTNIFDRFCHFIVTEMGSI